MNKSDIVHCGTVASLFISDIDAGRMVDGDNLKQSRRAIERLRRFSSALPITDDRKHVISSIVAKADERLAKSSIMV